MNKVMVAAVGVGLLLTAGCGSDDSPAAEGDQTTTPTTTTEAAAPTAPTPAGTSPAIFEVGQPVENGGLTVTVTSVDASPTVPVSDGAGGYRDRAAAEGSQYVVLSADIVNGMAAPIDLSCGETIGTRLADAQKQQFNVIADLDSVQGNRPCGDQLAPGTDGQIRWVFEVGADSVPKVFAFLNADGPEPTAVKVVNLSVD
ncbi:hypothetical protein [Rhodococcus gannanensis]|uniref:DUF4352 domain-containing protein n=1 Tax=Rhodococcus gannanensis TaxID=1960308 RepID=A0ABW4PCN7_9NOCA